MKEQKTRDESRNNRKKGMHCYNVATMLQVISVKGRVGLLLQWLDLLLTGCFTVLAYKKAAILWSTFSCNRGHCRLAKLRSFWSR